MLRRRDREFTGSCPVRQHTADGIYIGRCEHATYGGRCHLHGDVSRWLVAGADLSDADDRRLGQQEGQDAELIGERRTCPYCGALPDHPCMTISGRMACDMHEARFKPLKAAGVPYTTGEDR